MDAYTILKENILGTVATANEDGTPWATPVHVFYDNEAVYWFSHDTAQHSRNVAKSPRVSVVVFSPDESQGPKGVFVNGSVEILDGPATEKAKEIVLARLGKIPGVFEHATAYKLKLGELSVERSKNNCWYFYS